MKKLVLSFIFLFLIGLFPVKIYAANSPIDIQIEPKVCPLGSCPVDLLDVYRQKGEACVTTFDQFKDNPSTNHFWVEDPEVTTQGKADERARQFIHWVISKNSIDDHPTIRRIWQSTSLIAYALTILAAAVLGIGIIVGQRTQFQIGIKVWPSIFKIGTSLLYIFFSASLVIICIQLSEVLMKFFTENLGGRDLFNIYFGSVNQERNYIDFIGCRDLNFRVQEGADTQLFLLKLTNITYYVMGIMLLLRKIILWFLLVLSPFLAILLPFVFIRNIGFIWIGVFFQWLFYGPLFALFLGTMASIWKNGIPFPFDFSRAGGDEGYIFPTAINILYGGPAQNLTTLNNGNYIDTFVEYVITLIMLWAVTFFPLVAPTHIPRLLL